MENKYKIIQCPDCYMEFHSYEKEFIGIPEHICNGEYYINKLNNNKLNSQTKPKID